MKPLKEHFAGKFLVGAAVSKYTIEKDQELLKKHFNSITAENEMKPMHMQPEQGKFDFEVSDKMVQFAEDNGMEVRGHTLVWHNQMPRWFFTDENGDDVTRDELLKRMKDHIDAVVTRYKGRIHAWDVVNEAVEDRGEETYRSSKWVDIIGEDFIDYAFKYAHEADPDALLFYNDYNESHPNKREKIYHLVKGMLDRGIPIHGVGLQAHWNLYDPVHQDIEDAIKRYSELGLQLHVTEMDVSMFEFNDERTDVKEPTKEMLHFQAERYERFFDLFTKYSDNVKSVTFWGISDAYTWLDDFPVRGRKNWPFVLDEKGEPKPAYHRIVK